MRVRAQGLAALLDWADASGVPCAVVTNADWSNTNCMLDALGVRARFVTIVVADDCVAGKPAPEPYLVALGALGVASAARAFVFEARAPPPPPAVRVCVCARVFVCVRVCG